MKINKNFLSLYFNFLKKFIFLEKELKIVFDASDGVMGPILKEILPKIKNLNYILINAKPNKNFPHHGPDPTKVKALKQLKKIVLKNKADLGIAFDGDGDRAVFINETGKKIENAFVGWFLNEAIDKNKKKVVLDVLTYESLKYLNLLPKNYFLAKIGTAFFKNKMQEKKADLGIEHSGHFYFKDNNFKDDALVASLKFISYLSKIPFKINQYQKTIKFNLKTHQKNIKIKDFKNWQSIEKYIKKKYIKKIYYFDGITFEFENFFINIRKSNTEDFLRIYKGEIF